MNSRELKELIQKELDGEATPAERDQLRGILDTSREARAEYLAMEEMVRRIDQLVDGVEPPSQFKERVISSLREEGADPVSHERCTSKLGHRGHPGPDGAPVYSLYVGCKGPV